MIVDLSLERFSSVVVQYRASSVVDSNSDMELKKLKKTWENGFGLWGLHGIGGFRKTWAERLMVNAHRTIYVKF